MCWQEVCPAAKLQRTILLASPGLQPCNSKVFVFPTSWGHVQRTANMGPGVRSRDPHVNPGFFQLKFWTCMQAHSSGRSRACKALAACLSCRDKGLFTQLHFVWFVTSQVALSRRGTSPGEWEVVVNDMSDYPGGSLFFCGFPCVPSVVWDKVGGGRDGNNSTVCCGW